MPPYYAKVVPVRQMSPPAITIESSLADAAKRLAEASESPRLDAETLFAWVLDGLKNVLRGRYQNGNSPLISY